MCRGSLGGVDSNMKHPFPAVLGITVWSLSILSASSPAQTDAVEAVPRNASEETIILMIQHLAELQETGASLPRPPAIRLEQRRQMLLHVDTLLERYPKSSFRNRALILKLKALADLARTRPEDLKRLLLWTEHIDGSDVKGELASENAFYAMEAFVYGARYEGMPDKRRRIGTMERYEAFLEDCLGQLVAVEDHEADECGAASEDQEAGRRIDARQQSHNDIG